MQDTLPYIVCFGEVLWDVYPEGKRLGGAPFNVAAHMTQLGTPAYIISKIGNDDLGKEIIEVIRESDVSPEYIAMDYTRDTGVVNVVLDETAKPTYEIARSSAWDYIYTDTKNKDLVAHAQALVFGSLVCRSKRSKKSLFELIELSSLNICDLNIRLSFYNKKLVEELLEKTQILKINDEEAELLIKMFRIEPRSFYPELTRRFSLDVIIQTLGADGAEAYAQGELHKAAGIPVEVVDTVGSGDAFLAAFIHNYLKNESIEDCLKRACKLGAYVATQSGAIPKHRVNHKNI